MNGTDLNTLLPMLSQECIDALAKVLKAKQTGDADRMKTALDAVTDNSVEEMIYAFTALKNGSDVA